MRSYLYAYFDCLLVYSANNLGALVLGAYTDPLGLDSARAQRDLQTGKALAYTCYQMYGSFVPILFLLI